jgi:hypothetical protein
MRRIVMMSLAVILVVIGFYMERRREARDTGRVAGRMDSGASVPGQERIDPHGPAFVDPQTSPLRVDARVTGQDAQGLHVTVQVAAVEDLTGVEVTAERYDANASVAPDWSEEIWTGNLSPSAAHDLDTTIPFATAPPARMRVVARAVGTGGQRFSASAIVGLPKGMPTAPSH